MSRILFLVGMSGAGKTAWGRKMSTAYKMNFLDVDEYVERQQNKTVSQIFSEQGEQGFRTLEAKALKEIVERNKEPLIVSCGGGTPLNPGNYDLMRQNGYLVYLEASVETILENLKDHLSDRPLLKNGVISPAARIRELYGKRREIYERADYKFCVETLKVEDLSGVVALCR